MKNYVNKFAMFVALSCGVALAQGMPQSPQSPQTAPSSPSTAPSSPSGAPSQTDQSAPATPSSPQSSPDQAQPQSNPEGKGQATTPDTMPKSDQGMSHDQSKMPQSDTSASTSDVQSQIQSALQQDPKLANANITVTVSGKKLELNGTVASNDEKKQAEQIAKSHAGDLKVKNHIKIASANPPGQDKDKDKDKMAPPKQ